tara:strand:- start:623 stop:826 length:204 start_codon:yes stop_codon:yes gene_type:complete
VKKDYQDGTLFNSDNLKKIDLNTIKTTDVNVLLNRVRLDEKRTFKKKILFSITIAALVSLIAIFFTI